MNIQLPAVSVRAEDIEDIVDAHAKIQTIANAAGQRITVHASYVVSPIGDTTPIEFQGSL